MPQTTIKLCKKTKKEIQAADDCMLSKLVAENEDVFATFMKGSILLIV